MIGLPSVLAAISQGTGQFASVWYQWADAITKQANRDWGAGTTAQRPSSAGVGDRYFDTTLVLPIWYDGAIWIKADGTPA